jgi:hypothetical protein
MRKFFILALGLLSLNALAQTAAEEAIILNQELQYLEDSVNNVQAISVNTSDTTTPKDRALNEPSLERKYFGEEVEEDSISTRTAGPKRRSF